MNAVVIAALALLAFFPAVRNEFVFDDVRHALELEPARSFGEWLGSVAEPWWPKEKEKNIWRPVSKLALLAEKAAFGRAEELPAWPFHLVNVLLHAGACALTYAAARRLGVGAIAALIGGAVLAVHPLRSETVHQIVGQADLLAAIFILAGLIHFSFARERGWNWPATAAVQVLVYALALGSKENAVVYPFFLLVMWAAERPWRVPESRNLKQAMPMIASVAASAVFLLFFLWARQRVAGGLMEARSHIPLYENPLAQMAPAERIPAALGIFGYAVLKALVPFGLSPDYAAESLPFGAGWAWPLSWSGAAALAVLLAYAYQSWKSGGRGWAMVAGGLAAYGITSNLFFVVGVSAAERLWYFPLAPLWIGLGVLGEAVWHRSASRRPEVSDRIPYLALGVVVALMLAMTWRYSGAWRTPLDHAAWTVERFPRSWRGHYNLSREYYLAKDYEKGLEHARAAVALRPDDAESWGYLGLNMVFVDSGRPEVGEAFRRAIQLDPELDLAYEHLANWLMLRGQYEEALPYYEHRLRSVAPEERARIQEMIDAIRELRKP